MKNNLKFGEAKMIADECGVSVTTFNKALNGEIKTPIASIILMHTEVVIQQRESRCREVKQLIAKIKGGNNE